MIKPAIATTTIGAVTLSFNKVKDIVQEGLATIAMANDMPGGGMQAIYTASGYGMIIIPPLLILMAILGVGTFIALRKGYSR